MGKSEADLKRFLESVDHKSYPAYKGAKGLWEFRKYTLGIDHVQGDPFAAPSKLSVRMKGRVAGIPEEYYKEAHRRVTMEDFLIRSFGQRISRLNFRKTGSGKSGVIFTSRPGQEIFSRSACEINDCTGDLILRFEVGFPAFGRSINADGLIEILIEKLPGAIEDALLYERLNHGAIERAMFLADDQLAIRSQLDEMGLCAFVADGSVLPRESGVSQRPMKDAVAFASPESLSVTIETPHRGKVSGMGIRKGITLIVGGGYHGKSTLLKALEQGVYNHIGGDGRELCLTDCSAMKVRAEDGRSIRNVDISLFINDLPNSKDTRSFSTEDASGSTSQAANVVEALEAQTRLLLIDEDTCATNFMVRDALMQRVVARDEEPITPFLERITGLYQMKGMSTILVAGSSGAFFYVADTIIQMDRYMPKEITEMAKAAASEFDDAPQTRGDFREPFLQRVPVPDRQLQHGDRIKTKTLDMYAFSLDREHVELRGLEQIVDTEQTAALAAALKYLYRNILDGKKTVLESVEELMGLIGQKGVAVLYDGGTPAPGLALFRKEELIGCLNRFRRLKVR